MSFRDIRGVLLMQLTLLVLLTLGTASHGSTVAAAFEIGWPAALVTDGLLVNLAGPLPASTVAPLAADDMVGPVRYLLTYT